MQHTQHGSISGSTLAVGEARALLMESAGREVFDRLTRVAGLALRAPVAMLGIVDSDRLRIISQVGVPEPWTEEGHLPLDATFCRHVAATGDTLVVEDAARHPLSDGVRALENFPRVAYCGAPLRVAGHTVAVLSVCDREPRRWTAEDAMLIRDLAAAGLRDLELLAQGAPDPLERARGTPRVADVSRDAGGHPVPGAAQPAPDGFFTVDGDWRFTAVNEQARALLHLGDRDVAGRNLWELVPSLVGTLFYHECLRVIADRRACEMEDFCSSAQIWLEVRGYPISDGGAALHLRDISRRRTVQQQLGEREARYRRLYEDSSTALFVMSDDAMLVEANPALADLLGRAHEQLSRARLSDLAAEPADFARLLEELREKGAVADRETAFRHGSGHEIVCLVTGSARAQDGGTVYHGALRDVTVQKRAQDELVRTAFHDPLTGLPNRLVFMDRLERLLKHSRRRASYTFAVLFLDLDNFKLVNDTHGHMVGDELLIVVARRLEHCVRQEDTVARIGGDEFAVLLDMVHDVSGVILVVDRIKEALAEPFSANDRYRGATASIGIAMSMSQYERAEDLLRDADAAMYRAKAAGRNDYVIFDAEMHERSIAQRQLEDDLRAAVTREQLAVHYHPVVELDNGAVTGLEALIRWAHPKRGVLLPADFMPLAEQTGLIVDIGWWVLREACRQLRAWQIEYPNATFRLTMSVNLSSRQFVHPALVEKIDEILAETGLSPACLRLDLTEAVVMKNADMAARLLGQLRDRGIRICIDDFGTGYTSLRELREFPISTLKIDRSFINQLEQEGGQGREIVQTIIALGRSMAIDAIAEGVETPEQLAQLRALGTRFAQGFLFSLPLDQHAASALLRESAR
jgi:diguanylate cyclase (GGDEF)-like protein/PAS domain S-box-containing protein